MSVVGAFVLFAAVYRLLPARRLTWQAILTAAGFATALFTLGRIAIGFYLARSGVGVAFGPAGSLAVVLMWIYYASLSFLASTVVAAVVNEPEEPVAAPPARTIMTLQHGTS